MKGSPVARNDRVFYLTVLKQEGVSEIKMPDGVMANISHFDCDVLGSNPGLATVETYNGL